MHNVRADTRTNDKMEQKKHKIVYNDKRIDKTQIIQEVLLLNLNNEKRKALSKKKAYPD